MDAIVKTKLAKVLAWYKTEPTYDLCMIVLKSTNDCAVVYTVKDTILEPSYVEDEKRTECSFFDKALLSADLKESQVHFRVPVTTEQLYCFKDSTGKHAIMSKHNSSWRRIDILFADLHDPKNGKIHVYGTEESGPWSKIVPMDLSSWV